MAFRGIDPESYVTGYTPVHEENRNGLLRRLAIYMRWGSLVPPPLPTRRKAVMLGEVPRGEKVLYAGTGPGS